LQPQPEEMPATATGSFPVSTRIEALRVALIGAIVVLHADPAVELAPTHDLTSFVGNLLQHGPARSAVAVLSAISGYLLCKSRLDQTPGKLLRKKAATLIVPLVLWNLPLALVTAFAQARGKLLDQRLQLTTPDPLEWLNALLSLNANPVDYPLHFVRDLFVLALLAGLLSSWLRRWPLAVVIGVHVVFGMFNLDGNLLLRDDMPVMFFAGGALACVQADLTKLDGQWRALLVVFSVASLAHVLTGDSTMVPFLRMVSVLGVWPAFGALSETRFGVWLAAQSPYSFWVFASHAPVMKALRQCWNPAALGVPDALFWLWGPPVSIAIGVLTFRVAARVAPGFTGLLVGGRIGSSRRSPAATKKVELEPAPLARASE